LQDKHGKQPSPCPECCKVLNHPESLKRHMKTNHEPFPCETCGKMIKFKTAYKEHILTNHVPKSSREFECKICKKRFVYQRHLDTHMKVHKSVRDTYACKYCGKRLKSLNAIKYHEESAHLGIKKKPKEIFLTCEVCGKVMRKMYYNDHILMHNTPDGEFPYNCNVCLKGFSSKMRLKQHSYIHTNTRPYACRHCGNGFNDAGTRLQHEKAVHLGIKRKSKAQRDMEKNSNP